MRYTWKILPGIWLSIFNGAVSDFTDEDLNVLRPQSNCTTIVSSWMWMDVWPLTSFAFSAKSCYRRARWYLPKVPRLLLSLLFLVLSIANEIFFAPVLLVSSSYRSWSVLSFPIWTVLRGPELPVEYVTHIAHDFRYLIYTCSSAQIFLHKSVEKLLLYEGFYQTFDVQSDSKLRSKGLKDILIRLKQSIPRRRQILILPWLPGRFLWVKMLVCDSSLEWSFSKRGDGTFPGNSWFLSSVLLAALFFLNWTGVLSTAPGVFVGLNWTSTGLMGPGHSIVELLSVHRF